MEKKRFFLLSLTSYLIGFLYISCFWGGFSPVDGPKAWYGLLFTVVFLLWGNAIGKERTPNGQTHLLFFTVTALIAVAQALGRFRAVSGWGTLALHGAAGLWALYRTGGNLGPEEPVFFLWDILNSFVLLPVGKLFLRLTDVLRGLAAGFQRLFHTDDKKKRRDILIGMVCLLAALPLLFWTARLLTAADAGFGQLLHGILDVFRWDLPAAASYQVVKLLLGLPVGAYLYGLLAGSVKKVPYDRTAAKQKLQHMQVLPSAAVNGVWAMFAGLYVLFFLVQAGNLLAAFRGQIPGTLTAAKYARSGFFQLCLVMGINFLLLELGSLLAVRNRTGVILSAVLMVQSLLLAVTAGAKLWLYIHRFGFTPLRLLSAWAVVTLSTGCIFTLLHLAGKAHSFRRWLYFAVLTFTALCFY